MQRKPKLTDKKINVTKINIYAIKVDWNNTWLCVPCKGRLEQHLTVCSL